MKLHLNKLMLTLSIVATGANAAPNSLIDNDGQTYIPLNQTVFTADLITQRKSLAGIDNYMVLLEDDALAMYKGGLSGLSATNILASKGANVNARGKLNTKSLASKQYKSFLSAKQAEMQLHISLRLKRELNVEFEFTSVLNGFTTELNATEALLVKGMPGIRSIEKLEMQAMDTDSGPAFTGANNVWQQSNVYVDANGDSISMGEGAVVAVIDSGISSYKEMVIDIKDTENLPPFNPSFAGEVEEFEFDAEGNFVVDEQGNNVSTTYTFTNPIPNPDSASGYYGDCASEPNWCSEKLIGVMGIGVYGADSVSQDHIVEENGDITFIYSRWATGQDFTGHGTHVGSTAAGNFVYNVHAEVETGQRDHVTLMDNFEEEVEQRRIEGRANHENKNSYNDFKESFVYDRIGGVAPHANIISYQVCGGTSGGCQPGYAAVALEHAFNIGVDAVNYSVSGPATSPWYSWQALAFLGARQNGMHISASAGNTGAYGWGTVRTPANAPWLTSVGSASSDRGFDKKVATLSGGKSSVVNHVAKDDLDKPEWQQYIDLSGVLVGEAGTLGLAETELVLASNAEVTNAEDDWGLAGSCGPRTLKPELVAGKVVVCKRGGGNGEGPIARLTKGVEAYFAGAAGMILINTKTGSESVIADQHVLPALHLNYKNGKQLLEWLAEGEEHKVALSDSKAQANPTRANFPSVFSSRGPDIFSKDYLIPSITGPGQSIIASGLGQNMMRYKPDSVTSGSNWEYKSGTSMSTPHMTGIYAIIAGVQNAKPLEEERWTPAEAQSAVMLTAATTVRVWNGEFDQDNNEVFDPASFHMQGSGLMRVDYALKSGFVMPITRDEYLAADPYGDASYQELPDDQGLPDESIKDDEMDLPYPVDEYGDKILAPQGWHGKTHRLNLASLSKGDCLAACGWVRTFKAVKDATYNISYSYGTKGMVLNTYVVDESVEGLVLTPREEDEITSVELAGTEIITLSVTAGQTYKLYFTATVNDELDAIWSNGRIHFKSADSSIADMSLAAAVEFVAGTAPEEVNIIAHRDTGTVQVNDIVTIGSSDLTITESSITEAFTDKVYISRDKFPTEVYRDLEDGTYAYPFYVPSTAARLVIEVLDTSSPDIDMYAMVDSDADSVVDQRELRAVTFWDGYRGADAKIDVQNPTPGIYMLLIHNYGDVFNAVEIGEGEANPLHDPATLEEPDFVEFSISVVRNADEDDESLKVRGPRNVAADDEVTLDLTWNKAMRKGERYYGQFHLGTDDHLSQNIGTVNVNIQRGLDDVQLNLLSNNEATSEAAFEIMFTANSTEKDITYNMTVDLAAGTELVQFTHENVQKGIALKSAGEEVDYSINGSEITFEHVMAAGGNAEAVALVINYDHVEGQTDIAPVVTSIINEQQHPSYSYVDEAIDVVGRPVFTTSVSDRSPAKGDTVVISASLVDAVIENPSISYAWTQVSGPNVEVTQSANEISFVIPGAKNEGIIIFELTGHNGDKQSMPVEASVNVEATDFGGSTNEAFMLLALTALFTRRTMLRQSKA
ncbi:S8 family serine peptidase [Thalassotalea psychrophila]|uniref:S8 family serine peptidase n=1 Tax=Thalassotalea psychrophila TaxID=3065647 RepID=A0ABY9TZA6_9GAMM|nr:S8 family serine peptidase [Colwelliaceae bacterium SQ149]